MSTIKTSFAGNWITSSAGSARFSKRKTPLICPGCGKNYSTVPLKSKCDSCGCAFCFDGNCIGTKGGSKMAQRGLGRAAGRTCPKCGKGTLRLI